MKPDERLLELIGNIPEEMLDDALNVKKICRTREKRLFYGIAAAACMLVLFMRFVPAGQVMAAQIKEYVEHLLEELFPPKDIPLTVEGIEEIIPHEVYGELPKEAEEFPREAEEVSGESADKAGFAIYVDTDFFETAEEGTGVRLHYMIETFRVLLPSDSIQILASEEAELTTEDAK